MFNRPLESRPPSRGSWGLVLAWILFGCVVGGVMVLAHSLNRHAPMDKGQSITLPLTSPVAKEAAVIAHDPVKEATPQAESLLHPAPEPKGVFKAPSEKVVEITPHDAASSGALKPVTENMLETTPQGALPKIGPKGEMPWQYYGRIHKNMDQRPQIALVLYGLGRNASVLERASQLPPEVSLGLVPYTQDVAKVMTSLRDKGHEVLMTVSMEPTDFPTKDPGPQTLLTGIEEKDTLSRLHWSMSKAHGYVGVVNLMGDKYLTSARDMHTVLKDLHSRGVLFVEAAPPPRSVARTVAKEIGAFITPQGLSFTGLTHQQALEDFLTTVEKTAKEQGSVVVTGVPFPITMDILEKWIPTLVAKGIVLAPISATATAHTLPAIDAPVIEAGSPPPTGRS